MIAADSRNLWREDGRSVVTHFHIAQNSGSLLRGSYVPENAEAFSQGLTARRDISGVAAIDILGVITLFLQPEMLVDGSLQLSSPLGITLSLGRTGRAEFAGYGRHNLKGPVIYSIGSKAL